MNNKILNSGSYSSTCQLKQKFYSVSQFNSKRFIFSNNFSKPYSINEIRRHCLHVIYLHILILSVFDMANTYDLLSSINNNSTEKLEAFGPSSSRVECS